MLTDTQTNGYLARLELSQPMEATVENLGKLVYAHQTHIPFETVSLHRGGEVPSLDVDDLYDKVVVNELGGYCFELNKLFEELLKTLGYDARPVLSRAVRGREGRMPINHRGIVVLLDGMPHYVDVGFGGPMPSGALLLDGDADQDINGEIYAAKPTSGPWWKVERLTRAELDLHDDEVPERRQIELELCLADFEDQDFDALNVFFSSPGTLFRDHEIVNLRTPEGYLGYKDGVLTVRENGVKTIEELVPDEVDEMLESRFGMRLR